LLAALATEMRPLPLLRRHRHRSRAVRSDHQRRGRASSRACTREAREPPPRLRTIPPREFAPRHRVVRGTRGPRGRAPSARCRIGGAVVFGLRRRRSSPPRRPLRFEPTVERRTVKWMRHRGPRVSARPLPTSIPAARAAPAIRPVRSGRSGFRAVGRGSSRPPSDCQPARGPRSGRRWPGSMRRRAGEKSDLDLEPARSPIGSRRDGSRHHFKTDGTACSSARLQ
jgi:hypothetical protein